MYGMSVYLAGAVLEDGVHSLAAQSGLQRHGLVELLALSQIDRLHIELTRACARGLLSHSVGEERSGEPSTASEVDSWAARPNER